MVLEILKTFLTILVAVLALFYTLTSDRAKLREYRVLLYLLVAGAFLAGAVGIADLVLRIRQDAHEREARAAVEQIRQDASHIPTLKQTVDALTGMVTALQTDVRNGQVSRSALKRVADPLGRLLKNMTSILDKASDASPDMTSIGTHGWFLSPRISPAEKEAMAAQIDASLKALDALSKGE